jgi:hypothetical protein
MEGVNLKNSALSSRTSLEYDAQIRKCRELFLKKNHDYGTSWRVLRLSSLIDQVFIKAQRIRSIEEKKSQLVSDSVDSEFIGIINYCIIALIQMELGESMEPDAEPGNIISIYDEKAAIAKDLMERKNHDYGEAWRQMWTSSFTDLILSKLLRMRQIINNEGKTLVSEGLDANFYDIINYAVFALIKLESGNEAV